MRALLSSRFYIFFIPHTGDLCVAKPAPAIGKMVDGNGIPFPFYQQLTAVMAVRVGALMAGHISDIHIPYAFLHCQFTKAGQGGDRCRGQAVQFVFRKKPEEVKRMIGADVRGNPGAHSFHHVIIIHVSRNHKVCYFQVNIGFIQCFTRFQNGLESASVQPSIDGVVKGLQVDIGGIRTLESSRRGSLLI